MTAFVVGFVVGALSLLVGGLCVLAWAKQRVAARAASEASASVESFAAALNDNAKATPEELRDALEESSRLPPAQR